MINLLVTGGCGFIGSNFINILHSNHKYNIINIDCLNYCANENNVDSHIRESEEYSFYKLNINNKEAILNILEKHNINIVIHFAAQSHVQNSFSDSLLFTHDNVLGTHNLIEACRKYGKLEKFIHVSTDEVYGESRIDNDEEKKNELSILSPTNPYAATKAAAEMIVSSYHKSFKLPVIITRGNNVYGKNQYPEKLIPKFIKLLMENKKVTIQGNGKSVRGFLHVFDTAEAFIKIIENGVIGETYNIGCESTEEYTVLEIAKKLIQKIKNPNNMSDFNYSDYIEYIEDRPFNDMRYYISNKKIRELNWKPIVNFDDGLDSLIKIM